MTHLTHMTRINMLKFKLRKVYRYPDPYIFLFRLLSEKRLGGDALSKMVDEKCSEIGCFL